MQSVYKGVHKGYVLYIVNSSLASSAQVPQLASLLKSYCSCTGEYKRLKSSRILMLIPVVVEGNTLKVHSH